MAQTPRLIDGIVLTKFDTIDDKVRRLLRHLHMELPAGVAGSVQHRVLWCCLGCHLLPSSCIATQFSDVLSEEEGGRVADCACCPWQVGAAISMTYITSKPIVFVGTGQTYCDLRSLNAKAVVAALMKA